MLTGWKNVSNRGSGRTTKTDLAMCGVSRTTTGRTVITLASPEATGTGRVQASCFRVSRFPWNGGCVETHVSQRASHDDEHSVHLQALRRAAGDRRIIEFGTDGRRGRYVFR